MGVYAEYEVVSGFKNIRHPERIVESETLASVPPQKLGYMLQFPSTLLDPDKPILSGVQLDAIIMAGGAHRKTLAVGEKEVRQGFAVSDGTGTGKGRTVVGAILDNFLAGRRKAIWATCSDSLFEDCRRDLGDVLTATDEQIPLFRLPQAPQPVEHEEGILFVTYATLAYTPSGSLSVFPRIEQIKAWAGDDFDGIMVLDECHKAKGFKSRSTKSASTHTGIAVVRLQDELPMARVLYVSATIATSWSELQYMTRLGLWGKGTAWPDWASFEKFLKVKDVLGSEIVAVELKQRGLLVSRRLSFDDVSIRSEPAEMPVGFASLYDDCVEMWEWMKYLVDDGPRDMSQYFAEIQRFFRQLCTDSKYDSVVKQIKKALDGGRCVIVGLESTGEAAYQRHRESDYHTTSEPCQPTRVTLEFLLIKKYGISPADLGLTIMPRPEPKEDGVPVSEEEEDEVEEDSEESEDEYFPRDQTFCSSKSGTGINLKIKKQLQPSEPGDPKKKIGLSKAERKVIELYHKVKERLPKAIIDRLIREFGDEQVAELTGRKYKQIYISKDKEWREIAIPRTSKKISNLTWKFQNGDKKIAIVSPCASTGISLHCSNSVANKRRRVHIILEFPWTATALLQQMGRSHRSNQMYKPMYILMVAKGIPAERRFLSSLSRRIAELGAICQGDRRSPNDEELRRYGVPPSVGRKACRLLARAIMGEKTTLQLFHGNNAELERRRYYDIFKEIGVLKLSKDPALAKDRSLPKDPSLPKNLSVVVNANLVDVERFLNRMLCCKVGDQAEIIGMMDSAIQRILSQNIGAEDSEILDLTENLGKGAEFEKVREDFYVHERTQQRFSVVYIRSRRAMSWETVTRVHGVQGFYAKTFKGGKGKQCVLGVKVHQACDRVSSASIYYPWQQEPDKTTVSNAKAATANYKPIPKETAKALWNEELAFYEKQRKCSEFYKNGRCARVCKHAVPVQEVAVISGATTVLWNEIKAFTSGVLDVVRHRSKRWRVVGIFLWGQDVPKVENFLKRQAVPDDGKGKSA